MIRPGEEWGSPAGSPADLEIHGGDTALAYAVAAAPGGLIRFVPDTTSDLARAVGLRADDDSLDAAGRAARGLVDAGSAGTELPLDVLALGDGTLACNMCVFGTAPDRLRWTSPAPEIEIRLDGRPWFSGRATTVVVAIGQFLRGLDLVPRGHPGDGKAEVQVYELGRGERRLMRTRLGAGNHLPHPRIRQRSAATIELRTGSAVPAEVDGATQPATGLTTIEVVPRAYRLLV